MSINRYKPHIIVLPEDRANEEITNGFIQAPNVNYFAIQVERRADGWTKVLQKFVEVYVPDMRLFPNSCMVLLIDFDERKNRLGYVKSQIPDALKDRVFVLGVLSQPENLKTDLKHISLEKIGETLATGCPNHRNELWGHEILKHNQPELERMMASVKSFLFNNFL